MKFPVQCPHCREQVDMTFDLIGTDGNCQACGVDFVPVDASFGAENRSLLKRYLGAGGMGIVFAARDTALGRDVALKLPIIDIREQRRHKIVERFKTEIRAIERLNHPHICSIYDSARWDGHLYYTMRFLEGGTLADRVAAIGPVGCDEAVGWVLGMAQAMDYAHGMGVVHRDLKPANLMFDSGDNLLVTDFGLALFIDDPDGTRLHPRRRSTRLSRLHGARAGARVVGLAGPCMRHLCAGRDPLRAAHRTIAISRPAPRPRGCDPAW